MKLGAFLLRYFRHYWAWVLLAGVAALFYGILTAGIVALIEPVFGEVLLAGGESSSLMGALGGEEDGTSLGSEEAEVPEPTSGAKRFFARFQLKDQLDRGYAGLKRHFGVDQDNVVYFLPILVVVVFLFGFSISARNLIISSACFAARSSRVVILSSRPSSLSLNSSINSSIFSSMGSPLFYRTLTRIKYT